MNEELRVAPPVLRDMPEPVEGVPKSVYTRTRMEQLRDYNINIRFLSVGCIIEVGCKQIPFTTVKEGLQAFNEYVADPEKSTNFWSEKFRAEE